MNEYFVPGAVPAPNSPGSSAIIRAEFTSIAAAFDKLPVLAGSAGEFVIVNETGTAMIASGNLASDFVTLSGTQTLTNKTLAWADNTWSGFGTGATKTAGTGADNVLLLAENAKLPALDGSLLTNLNPAELGLVAIANGGTGASTLGGAQTALGIDLKADANNAVLTGAPTCPTPPVGNSSARIANTQFVTDTVRAIGAAIPSDATPLMNGVAAPGVHTFVARDDHVHPVDTSRAPASAATATGTSFSPVGGIAATNVQAAISELDTEKAPLASPALTGTPTSTTPLTSDNSTRIATTAFMQSLLAQQPPGVEVSDSTPLMNGVAAPGTGVEASRHDHVHPTDTSRAPTASPTFSGTMTHSGDLIFSGVARRIKGDFSNSTVADRLMFQTSKVNGLTSIGVLPNGTNKASNLSLFGGADPANASVGQLINTGADVRFAAIATGSGTYLPMTFYTGGAERMRIDAATGAVGIGVDSSLPWHSAATPIVMGGANTIFVGTGGGGNLAANLYHDDVSAKRIQAGYAASVNTNKGAGSITLSTYPSDTAGSAATAPSAGFQITQTNCVMNTPNGGLGYGPGAGGTVTQATSKSTPVTLNKPTGKITMNAAALAAGATAGFVLNNTLISGDDCPICNAVNNANYRVETMYVINGQMGIRVTNVSAGSLSDALVINFDLFKGASS